MLIEILMKRGSVDDDGASNSVLFQLPHSLNSVLAQIHAAFAA